LELEGALCSRHKRNEDKHLATQESSNVAQIHRANMAEAPKPSGSLADRISEPAKVPTSPPVAPTAASDATPPKESKDAKTDLPDAQVDGAAEQLGGSTLHEPQYDVEVKLSDIQGDSTSPLYSISSFEELGM
jgi:ATP-dependent RNA helicase DDX19/DBP5